MFNADIAKEQMPLKPIQSPRVRAAADVEEFCLDLVPGLGNEQRLDDRGPGGSGACASCCNERHYRGLAVCSIMCGCTCIGYHALINSVKAETSTDPEAAEKFSRRARKLAIISILTWISVLLLFFLLMVLISYLITFID